MRPIYFITHPNVVIDPEVPVQRWPLSMLGRERMVAMLGQPWIQEVTAIYCSTEQKAIDGAQIIAGHLSLPFTQISELGENDRNSTGFLEPAEFERVADVFFSDPENSVRGWERAIDAQSRIVRCVETIAETDNTTGAIAIVSHGAVGALLFCALSEQPISRKWDQPPTGGGNYFRCSLNPKHAEHWWKPIDAISDRAHQL